MREEHSFALCLTHDVDRPYKTFQAPYRAVTERSLYHLKTALPGNNPYWQFEEIMELEADLGVRSAFYFLEEQNLLRDKSPREWTELRNWVLYTGRYSVTDPAIADVIRRLDEGGWEVGLHGSYESYRDIDRLREEKETLEGVLGHEVSGIRQHYLNLERPRTWELQSELGFDYDATLGRTREYGFHYGYNVLRPLNDEFVVFPLTLMELTLPDVPTDADTAWEACERLLERARDRGAIMTVLWHPCYFNEREYPNYKRVYRKLVERALEMGAWVGPPRELLDSLRGTDAQSVDFVPSLED
ncbi:polysaccharide deacetylase family protein [Halogeometricum luteum]|uniref:Polysaccharide deacetylase family protein n=1 Tax=Halogeometricum luteum TaxID=2950537 RepID=A0ABU2G516_9EURY|nr:polysaccharide deacetylase family protein [Halogeometricum sp. S3BR5-2]MDS0295238.1 polysaccharide deacetylase family protein [Halogeometricum sp. S3BR5-2]